MPGKQSSSIIDDQRNTPQYKRELALCKKAGGDIAAIFKLNLDLKQLTEVRKGLVAAVDIYKYMDPERPWVDMQEYRLELEQNVDLTKYRQQDYDVEQLAELRQGLVDGVDITQFDNKNYTPEQMKQLRLGLAAGIPVIFFSDLAYDYLQMEEIRKGLEKELDISCYASSDIPFLKMRAIRECLEAGLTVTDQMIHKWDARVIRQWQIGARENIDLTDYIRLGFDADQLEQIRIAKEDGLEDFDRFLMPEMRGESLKQIRLGMESKVDVLSYANGQYNWKQMQEIRLGLEKGLDINFYSNPKFHASQMKEIRLGLESNIEVRQYRSFMYTANEMYQLRKWMEAGKIVPDDKREVFDDLTLKLSNGKKNKNDVDWEFLRTTEGSMITVSDDLMSCHMTLSPLGDVSRYTTDFVLTLLFKAKVRKGILRSVIDEMINEHQFGVSIKVAEGKLPEDGKDGYYEYFFNKFTSTDPDILEDGTADFSNVMPFEPVNMGDKLAVYHKAQAGVDGYTVTGEITPAKRGKDLPQLEGRGFMLLNDKITYVSALNGVVKSTDTTLDVFKLDRITKENMQSNAPEYPGSVIVSCDVSMGTEIRAAGDIIIEGNVELATIKAGGSVLIRGSCAGSTNDRCTIIAGGIVAGTSFDTTDVSAGGNIMSNSCTTCKLVTRDKVIMFGENGFISGGLVSCLNGVETSVLGSRYKRETVVNIGVSGEVMAEYENIKNEIKAAQNEMKVMSEQLDKLNAADGNSQGIVQMKVKIKTARNMKEKALTEMIEKRSVLEAKINQITGAVVMVSNICYMGVVITIDGVTFRNHENLEKYGGMTFYRNNKTVEIK